MSAWTEANIVLVLGNYSFGLNIYFWGIGQSKCYIARIMSTEEWQNRVSKSNRIRLRFKFWIQKSNLS